MSSVSGTLGAAAGDLVDRVKEGRGYRYRIMSAGEEHLSTHAAAKASTQPNNSPRPTKRTPKKKDKEDPTSKSIAKKRGDRLGPKKLLEQLIEEKFFLKPRIIKDVIEHVAEASGRTYKATDLSPALVRLLREKQLTRAKNADGQYEYIAT